MNEKNTTMKRTKSAWELRAAQRGSPRERLTPVPHRSTKISGNAIAKMPKCSSNIFGPNLSSVSPKKLAMKM
jgi:hypothetical protein